MRAQSILMLVLITLGCDREAPPASSSKPPDNEVWVTPKQISEAGIMTVVVERRPIGSVLIATGRIAFSDSRVSHVFSPITGRVRQVLRGIGRPVARGEPLAIIQSPDLASAVADLQKAEADLAAAQRDYDRQKELYEGHAASQRDFEAAESNFHKAKAERDRAAQKCRLFQAGSANGDYVLSAPIAGEIVSRAITPGMEVQGQYSGGNAQELFTIGNFDPVWVIADVFEIDLPRLRIGASATVSVLAYPDHTFTGTVDWISSALDPVTRSAKVRCIIRNPQHLLRPEMYATAAIQTDRQPKLSAPRSAIIRVGDQMVAYVDRGAAPNGSERFERRTVSIDDTQSGQFVPVIAGLNPGDRVVSSGALILSGESS